MDAELLVHLLEQARRIALDAGEAILAVSLEPGEVTDKADGSPLTRADLASHRVITAGLRALEPALPVVSEEGDVDAAVAAAYETFWLVDPLDGTKEFIQGLDEYTVNIALIEAGLPILGVVGIPPAGTLYYAARGRGAFQAAGSAPPRRLVPSDCDRPRTAVVSRSHRSAETDEYLARLGIAETLPRGSALKLCAVAEGSADIYPRLGPTCLWDTAAGAAVAREAGCAVTDLTGEDLLYDLAGGVRHEGFLVYPAKLRGLPGLVPSE